MQYGIDNRYSMLLHDSSLAKEDLKVMPEIYHVKIDVVFE
jgi:hypothetical protein